jgi:hypothetical protein
MPPRGPPRQLYLGFQTKVPNQFPASDAVTGIDPFLRERGGVKLPLAQGPPPVLGPQCTSRAGHVVVHCTSILRLLY